MLWWYLFDIFVVACSSEVGLIFFFLRLSRVISSFLSLARFCLCFLMFYLRIHFIYPSLGFSIFLQPENHAFYQVWKNVLFLSCWLLHSPCPPHFISIPFMDLLLKIGGTSTLSSLFLWTSFILYISLSLCAVLWVIF